MKRVDLTRAIVKKHVRDNDNVVLGKPYAPETHEHRKLWSKLTSLIGETGEWYSTLRAACGDNKDYIAYLVGDLQVLRIPKLEERLGLED
jgi:hypothetical protein